MASKVRGGGGRGAAMRVFLDVAMSADGKIAPPERRFVPLAGPRDRAMVMKLRRRADAVVVGGATFRADPHALVEDAGGGAEESRARPMWNVVVTRRPSSVPVGAPALSDPRVRVLVVAPAGTGEPAPPGAELVELTEVTAAAILAELEARGAESVLLEAGGGLVSMFLREGRLDEMFITVAPLVLGGGGAPSPVDGIAFLPETAPRLSLVSAEAVGDEVFLHYRVLPAT